LEKDLSQAIKLAAAVELYGTALLIHDMYGSFLEEVFHLHINFESLATKTI
jgi:hypothetical protein